MAPRMNDRRDRSREQLYISRRRYPRLTVKADVFYESDTASIFAPEVDLSLRGMFVANLFPDVEGALGTVHVDLGEGHLVKAEVEVVRSHESDREGMALRIVSMPEADRLRFTAYLLRRGGLAMLPQLDRRFHTLALAPRPLEALAAAA
jgi:hypothetical protein